MREIYILEVPKKQMPLVADMLRYDDCFEVDETEDTYKVHCCNFTRDRWVSFGFVPKVLLSWKVTAKDENELLNRAIGFTEGVRFAQKLLNGYLIQGR